MSQPNDSPLPHDIQLTCLDVGQIELSPAFVDLLVVSRTNYNWPTGTGATKSQQTVINLANEVGRLKIHLDSENAHTIIKLVSEWAGNNARGHAAIANATTNDKQTMLGALNLFENATSYNDSLDLLSGLPGISLVIASKIFRFFSPKIAAAVDRHASYFFNSLNVISLQGTTKSTHFKREWTTANHTSSRLATFSPGYFKRNRQEYTDIYLPLLASIAAKLNSLRIMCPCAATLEHKYWHPTDVEMAAYYWWASNGAR